MEKQINFEKIVDYIKDLVNIPSPTGFTHLITEYLINNAKSKNIDYTLTKKNAVIYSFRPSNLNFSKNLLFAAHVDTLGAIVSEVKDYGLKFSPIGGYPPIYIVGDYCKIHTFDGKIYSGTILPENPAVHVNAELNKKFKTNELYIRVDLDIKKNMDKNLKAHKNDKNTGDNNINLKEIFSNGNFISFDPKFDYIDGFVKSRHLDDKASAAIFLYLSDLILENKIKLKNKTYFYFNITEETGQGIAGLPEIDEMIIVDMGCVGNSISGDEYSVSIAAKDSSGPYDYETTQKLIKIAKENKINYKIDIFPYYGSDGSAALRAGNDLKVALIGQGVSASHGYERTHIEGLKNTLELIKLYIES